MRLAIVSGLYFLATLVHFVHNAEYLASYPSMPAWLDRETVYAAWAGVTAVGIAGWLLLARGWRAAGLLVVATYALLGFDALAHYHVAAMADHTAAMHMTIWLEVGAAAILLAAVAAETFRRRRA